VPTAPQIAKIDIVWYKFAQEGIPQKQFLQNVGLQLPKSQKMVIYGINLPLRENAGIHIEKLEYRCTTRKITPYTIF